MTIHPSWVSSCVQPGKFINFISLIKSTKVLIVHHISHQLTTFFPWCSRNSSGIVSPYFNTSVLWLQTCGFIPYIHNSLWGYLRVDLTLAPGPGPWWSVPGLHEISISHMNLWSKSIVIHLIPYAHSWIYCTHTCISIYIYNITQMPRFFSRWWNLDWGGTNIVHA